MATLARVTLSLARIITEVLEGVATAGNATSLTDTTRMIQPNQYWDRGTLWVLSGTYAGRVLAVTAHAQSKVTFSTITPSALAASDKYALARAIYPWERLVAAVNDALDEVRVIEEDTSLVGDGTTLEFNIPATVDRVRQVHFKDPQNLTYTPPSTHFRQWGSKLRFDYGYAPPDSWTIVLRHETDHPVMSLYSDEVNSEVNQEWLRWKAAEFALYWGAKTYGDDKNYNIEILMDRVMGKQKGLYPTTPIITVHTA